MSNIVVMASKSYAGRRPMYWLEERKTEEKSYKYYHYDRASKDYTTRTFIMLEALYVNYLINYQKERFAALLNNGKLYLEVMRRIQRTEKAVDKQLKILCENDIEFQRALAQGQIDRCDRLERNLKSQAEEIVYAAVLYV